MGRHFLGLRPSSATPGARHPHHAVAGAESLREPGLWSGNLVEAITHPAQRHEPLGAQLAAQVANVDVDDVGAGIEVVTPDVAEQLF